MAIVARYVINRLSGLTWCLTILSLVLYHRAGNRARLWKEWIICKLPIKVVIQGVELGAYQLK